MNNDLTNNQCSQSSNMHITNRKYPQKKQNEPQRNLGNQNKSMFDNKSRENKNIYNNLDKEKRN